MIGKLRTSPKPRLLLYGDSHSEAIFRAAELRAREGRPTAIAIHRARRTKGNIILGDTSLEEFFNLTRRLTESDVVISMIGGNQHAVFSTVQHPVPFDLLEPGATEQSLRPDSQIIPYRALSSVLDSAIRGRDGRTLEKLRSATRAKLIHIMSPPPKRDSEFIRSYHETRFRGDIANLGVSPPELRMKIWRLQRSLTQALCDELDIELMGSPAKVLDADGFLRREYYGKDATHANRAFGMLVLERLERRFALKVETVA